jgi:hypothetical protein
VRIGARVQPGAHGATRICGFQLTLGGRRPARDLAAVSERGVRARSRVGPTRSGGEVDPATCARPRCQVCGRS